MDRKIILISGGSDGLGKATAKLLSPSNTVVILAPDPDKTKSVAQELNCDYQVCDIASWDLIDTAVKNTLAQYQKIDVLINNAGVWIEGPLDQNDPENIKKVIDVNTLGTIWLTRACLPSMKQNKSGLIINIISQAGLKTKPDRSVYYASKWAITGFTKCLEEELSSFGIKVIGVYPDKMRTNLFTNAGINKDLSDALDPNQVAQNVVGAINDPQSSPDQIEIKLPSSY